MAYYTGCFAQLKEPNKLYNEIIDNLDSKPQTGQNMFDFLKLRTSLIGNAIDSHFKIPLKLIPEFKVETFSYIYNTESEKLELYLPDVVLSLNNEILESINGTYDINFKKQSYVIKIKYNNQVYTIIVIKKPA
jgi:hypothetical protein